MPAAGFTKTAGNAPSEAPLVSVVEDEPFVLDSMRRLVRSLGYAVAAFSSAADFLASPDLAKTAVLIADVHMPAMTGVELHRHLVHSGFTIPTILVTAYPDDVVRARVQKEGVICYLRKPLDEKYLIRCLLAALRSGKSPENNS
jgi:FixJ family two-component response regulator